MSMEWISVKDKLAPQYDWVLVAGDDGGIAIARYWEHCGWRFRSSVYDSCLVGESVYDEGNSIRYGDMTFTMNAIEITHWMPMPSPPP